MTLIWTDPPDSTWTRLMKSATGGASIGLSGIRPLRSTSSPLARPPALSPPTEALHPVATVTVRVSASRAPAFVSFMSGSWQGDVQLEDGPVRCEGEDLAARAEDRRPEQRVGRPRPFRDQTVCPVVDPGGPGGVRSAARHVRVARGIDRRLAHVSRRCPGRAG